MRILFDKWAYRDGVRYIHSPGFALGTVSRSSRGGGYLLSPTTPRVIVATTATPMPSSTQRVIAADTPVPTTTSRTDGDPGANGYRCPYCNSRTNSYSYASAAYSHTATPGE